VGCCAEAVCALFLGPGAAGLVLDNGGVSRFFDNLPVATQQATRRQRNDTIVALFLRENVLQDLRRCEAEIIQRKVTALKSLDRRSEEALDFDIQIEKTIIEQANQSCAYGSLADTADAAEQYSHNPTFCKGRAIPASLPS